MIIFQQTDFFPGLVFIVSRKPGRCGKKALLFLWRFLQQRFFLIFIKIKSTDVEDTPLKTESCL